MAKTTPTQPAPPEADAFNPAVENLAVARCCAAYASTQQSAKDQGKGNVFIALDAIEAFRKTLPPLCGYQNICDFIACVAHGMLIGAMSSADGARLLYAAQVAHIADRRQSASPKSPPRGSILCFFAFYDELRMLKNRLSLPGLRVRSTEPTALD